MSFSSRGGMALPAGEGLSRLDEDDRRPTEHICMAVGPVARVCKFRGLQHGDRVYVVDMYWPQLAGIAFQFLNYSENLESGIGWVEVFGGPKGHQHVRAFPVHTIRVPTRKA